MEVRVKKAISYGKSIIGSPYIWWKSGKLSKGAPSWVENEDAPDPEFVIKSGANCAGLTNLMLRSVGNKIPTCNYKKWNGGTYAYFNYYLDKSVPFDIHNKYPEGTLLLRNYRSVVDQGHVAVVLENGKVLQSYSENGGDGSPGVNDNISIIDSHAGYYYEIAVLPENWLGKI